MKWAGLKVNESHSVASDSWTILGILQTRILEWVAFPFSMGSFQSRGRTQILYPWATREAQEYWSGYPIPSPEDLSDSGIEPGSPALLADSLPAEPSGKPLLVWRLPWISDNADILGTLLWEPSRLKWKHEHLHWLCSWIQHCTDHSGDITHLMKKREMS